MDDARKRAHAFNAEQRIAELEFSSSPTPMARGSSPPRSKTHLLAAQERLAELETFLSDEREVNAILRRDAAKNIGARTEREVEVGYLQELTRLEKKKVTELKQSVRELVAHADGTKNATDKRVERARWRLEH